MSAGLPIAVAVGDPCGVGPIVGTRAVLARSDADSFVLFGDARQLGALANAQGARVRKVELADLPTLGTLGIEAGVLRVCDTGALDEACWTRHEACPEAGEAQLRTLRAAANAVRAGAARALVTGPTSKAAIVSAGHAFVGQTEFLAQLDGKGADEVTMLFLGPKLRVGLVTTHLSIRDVPEALTVARVRRTARHLAEALLQLEPERQLSLLVTGLNPHAGEGGLFGDEEPAVITPALISLRDEEPFCSRIKLGPAMPAEAVFRAAQRGEADGVVAMFHDQATIASKLLDWGAAVNTTWGLSFVRTSVDHGVAYDAAASGRVDDGGMRAALEMARLLTRRPHG